MLAHRGERRWDGGSMARYSRSRRHTPTAVGLEVARLRNELRLTQAELAERGGGGLSQAYISAVESGAVDRPTREKLLAIAAGLGIDPAHLLLIASDLQPAAGAAAAPFADDEVLGDLVGLVRQRPDLLQFLHQLRDRTDEEGYQLALAIVRRHLLAAIETARDAIDPPQPASNPAN